MEPGAKDVPPQHLVELAMQVSGWSPCRSKRGSVIFDRDGNVIAHGHNYKPQGFECDGSAACKATCRVEAIHAEQRALLDAGSRARGAEMLHVKTVNGALVASGGPSCVQCSKLGMAAGVTAMWLHHETGWRRYDTSEWHRLSLLASRPGGAAPGEERAQKYRTGIANIVAAINLGYTRTLDEVHNDLVTLCRDVDAIHPPGPTPERDEERK
jgi:deoxycytidylate deaminase